MQKSNSTCLSSQPLFQTFHWGPYLVSRDSQNWSRTFFRKIKCFSAKIWLILTFEVAGKDTKNKNKFFPRKQNGYLKLQQVTSQIAEWLNNANSEKRPATLLKKETLAHVFSFAFSEISPNTFCYRTPPVDPSVSTRPKCDMVKHELRVTSWKLKSTSW